MRAHGIRFGQRSVLAGVSLGLIGTLILALAGPAAASGSRTFFPPAGFNGWYSSSSVTGTIQFEVDSSFRNFREEIRAVSCDGGPNLVAESPSLPTRNDIQITVTVSGDTAFGFVRCQATYFESEWHCPFICGYGEFEFSGVRTEVKSLKIDSSPPVDVRAIPSAQPNAAGWYNTAGSVRWTGTDPTSGIIRCDGVVPFGNDLFPDGHSRGIFGRGCRNVAGLFTQAPFLYKFDGTDPTLNPSISPNDLILNGPGTASPNATDATSGIASQSCDPVDTSSVGTRSVDCTATDVAGNTAAIVSLSYSVAYGFEGFGAPVKDGVNEIKAGRAVPLKFRVVDANGAPVLGLPSASVSANDLGCAAGSTPDLAEEQATGHGLQNLGNGNYQWNWKVPKSYEGSCKELSLDLGDNVSHSVQFSIK